ncbi:MAG: retroviral-like aspartic protease family protein [Candidatus Melainabacteria bacterium]|nr:retroviral-like aspartic protease family protein [Candidatus Melainabacteria bacterium]
MPLILVALLLSGTYSVSAASERETRHAAGMADYKRKDYAVALANFEAAMKLGDGSAENYLYIAHCHASLGKRQQAVKVYNDIKRIFAGSAAATMADRCIKSVDPNGLYSPPTSAASSSPISTRVATSVASSAVANMATGTGSPQTGISMPGSSGSTSGVTSHTAVISGGQTPLQLRQGSVAGSRPATGARTASQAGRTPAFINRINIVPPAAGHPSVNSSTVGALRSVISRLPSNVYALLEESGATVTVAPNISDKWPERRNQSKPGMERITLDQDCGLTEGRDIYIFERPSKDIGGKDLDEPFETAKLHEELISQFAQAINNYLGVSNEKAFVTSYDTESGAILHDDKHRMDYYLQPGGEGAKVVCSAAITGILGGDHDALVDKHFPKTKLWVKTRMDDEFKRRSAMAVRGGRGPKTAVKPYTSVMKAESAFASKVDSKIATLSMPPEERIPYDRRPGDHLYVRGSINGRPTHILIDTGAFKVVVGKNDLLALGIKPPDGKSQFVGSGAAGALRGWEMPLEVSIGRIKRKLPVQVIEGSQAMLLGQPFLSGMHYQIDRHSNYIHFMRDSKDFAKEMSYDSVEIPFRMLDGNMMVSAKVNGKNTEMNFDTGAPYTLFSMRSMMMCDLEPLGQTQIHGAGGSSTGAYVCQAGTIELGSIRKQSVQVVVSPSCGQDVLGQDFFGHMKFIVDNEKKVIRIAR